MEIRLVSDLSLTRRPPQGIPPQTRALLSWIESQMVVIPAGTFQMGTENGRFVEPRRVIIRTFLLAAHDVTFDEYDTYAGATGRTRPNDSGWGRGKRPVVNVSWEDAQAFIVWLNQQSGKHFRLPSEAEWEYAARAGTTTRYYWGDQFDSSRANNNKTSTTLVGLFPPNNWGLFDMSGNVYQWTQDCWNVVDFWTGRYKNAPSDGAAWTTGECIYRVIRGGSWTDDPWGLRVSSREHDAISTRANFLGFRIAQDP